MSINTIKELLDLGYSIAEIEKISKGVQPEDTVTEKEVTEVAEVMGTEKEVVSDDVAELKEELKMLKETMIKKNIQESTQPEKEETTLDILSKFVR